MRGFDDSFGWFLDEVEWFVSERGMMIAGNLFLALLPLLLAALLFRPAVRRTPAWWVGVVAFVLLLPNAAYVLTDVVHLLSDVRSRTSDLSIVTVFLPGYAAFFAIGFGCYVVSLLLVRDHVGRVWPSLPGWAIELALQALTAVGIFLGRVARLNSWDVVRDPSQVTSALPELTTRFPLLFIAFTFVALVALTAVAKPILRAAARGFRRGSPWGLARP